MRLQCSSDPCEREMEGSLGGRVLQGSAVLGGSARLLRSLQDRVAHQRSRVSPKDETALVSLPGSVISMEQCVCWI